MFIIRSEVTKKGGLCCSVNSMVNDNCQPSIGSWASSKSSKIWTCKVFTPQIWCLSLVGSVKKFIFLYLKSQWKRLGPWKNTMTKQLNCKQICKYDLLPSSPHSKWSRNFYLGTAWLATSLSNLFGRTSHQGQLELILKQLKSDGSFVQKIIEQYHAGVDAVASRTWELLRIFRGIRNPGIFGMRFPWAQGAWY